MLPTAVGAARSCCFVAFMMMDVLGSRDQPGPGSTRAPALRHGGGGGTSLTGSSARRGSGDHQSQGGGSHWANYYLIPEHSFPCSTSKHTPGSTELLRTIKQRQNSKGESVFPTQAISHWSLSTVIWFGWFLACYTHTHLHTGTLEPVIQVTSVLYLIQSQIKVSPWRNVPRQQNGLDNGECGGSGC